MTIFPTRFILKTKQKISFNIFDLFSYLKSSSAPLVLWNIFYDSTIEARNYSSSKFNFQSFEIFSRNYIQIVIVSTRKRARVKIGRSKHYFYIKSGKKFRPTAKIEKRRRKRTESKYRTSIRIAGYKIVTRITLPDRWSFVRLLSSCVHVRERERERRNGGVNEA